VADAILNVPCELRWEPDAHMSTLTGVIGGGLEVVLAHIEGDVLHLYRWDADGETLSVPCRDRDEAIEVLWALLAVRGIRSEREVQRG